MITRRVIFPVFIGLDQQPCAASIVITLVDAGGLPLLAQYAPDGDPIGGDPIRVTTALDAETEVPLVPNTEIGPASAYHVLVAVDTVKRGWTVKLPTQDPPDQDIPITWAELIGIATPLSAAEVSALALHLADNQRHIPNTAGFEDGSLMGLIGGIPTWVPPPDGTGDMSSLVYDPAGLAADVYDASNLTGSIDAGTFT